MSLILDALNKADQEKDHQGDVPDLKVNHYGADKGAGKDAIVIEKKHLLLALLVVLGLAVIVLLGLLLSRDARVPAAPASARVTDAPPATSAPAPVETSAAAPSVTPSIAPPVKAAKVKPAQAGPAEADNSAFGRQMLTPLGEETVRTPVVDDEVAALYQTQVDETPQRIVTPTVAPAEPSRPPVDRDQVAQLWQEMNQSRPVPLPPGVEIARMPARTEPAKTDPAPKADSGPKLPEGVELDESVLGHSDVLFLHELPVAFQDTIPTLMYNKHDYAQGFVIINKKRYHEGETLAAGVVLEDLLADGVLLRFSDRAFKLSAESSWVNY